MVLPLNPGRLCSWPFHLMQTWRHLVWKPPPCSACSKEKTLPYPLLYSLLYQNREFLNLWCVTCDSNWLHVGVLISALTSMSRHQTYMQNLRPLDTEHSSLPRLVILAREDDVRLWCADQNMEAMQRGGCPCPGVWSETHRPHVTHSVLGGVAVFVLECGLKHIDHMLHIQSLVEWLSLSWSVAWNT